MPLLLGAIQIVSDIFVWPCSHCAVRCRNRVVFYIKFLLCSVHLGFFRVQWGPPLFERTEQFVIIRCQPAFAVFRSRSSTPRLHHCVDTSRLWFTSLPALLSAPVLCHVVFIRVGLFLLSYVDYPLYCPSFFTAFLFCITRRDSSLSIALKWPVKTFISQVSPNDFLPYLGIHTLFVEVIGFLNLLLPSQILTRTFSSSYTNKDTGCYWLPYINSQSHSNKRRKHIQTRAPPNIPHHAFRSICSPSQDFSSQTSWPRSIRTPVTKGRRILI